MNDLKEFQDMAVDDYTMNMKPAKVDTEFPISAQIEVGVDFEAKEITFGPWFNYTNTKGGLTYVENNSAINVRNDLTRLSIGFKMLRNIYKSFGTYGKVGLNASILEVSPEGSMNLMSEYLSNGGSLELGIQWKYSFKRIALLTNFGYEAGLNGNFSDRASGSRVLKNLQAKSVKPNWSGLRLGIGLSFSLAKTYKELKPRTIEVD
jgi:hypothetical protein